MKKNLRQIERVKLHQSIWGGNSEGASFKPGAEKSKKVFHSALAGMDYRITDYKYECVSFCLFVCLNEFVVWMCFYVLYMVCIENQNIFNLQSENIC